MKICFDYEIFWKQRFSGIASRYFYNIIKTLLNYNYLDVKVFSKYYLNKKLDTGLGYLEIKQSFSAYDRR